MRINRYKVTLIEEFFDGPDLKPGVMLVSLPPHCMAHFLCPCGCGVQYDLPIGESPTRRDGRGWEIEINSDGNIPTISPSVLNSAPGQCGSHFFIRGGKVEWC